MTTDRQLQNIQLLLTREKNRELLESWFDEQSGYVVHESTIDSIDLECSDMVILDSTSHSRHQAKIAEYKSEKQTTFLPILLVHTGAEFPEESRPFSLVDDIIETPIRQATLSARVENLLERRRLSQELYEQYERSEERFRRIFESSNDAIFVVGVEGKEIIECNPAACTLVGFLRDELLELSPVRDLHPDDADHYRTFIRDVEKNGQGWTDEMTYRTKEGRRIIAEVSASTIEVGDQISIVVCARDITQRKLSEQQLQVLNRVLRHNLRNDMNVIHGCGNMLSSKIDDGDLQKHTQRIVNTSNDLIALSEKTRELNKVIQWHQDPRHIDIIRIIDNLRREFEEKYSTASVRFEIPEEADAVADDRINYVLDELIENAIKHNDRSEPLVEISATVFQEKISIEIIDDGPGISPQEHAVLLGEETPLLHGSGLGLWIVNWIVTSVGGELDLDTNEPRGSVVTVTLPRSTVRNESKPPTT